MTLQVSDCLILKYDIWVSYEGKDYETHIIPFEHFGKDDLEHIDWERSLGNPELQRGWCYRWYDSGTDCVTENGYSDIFNTKQEAFDNAYADINQEVDDGGSHGLEWLTFAKDNELNDKVVVTSMNGYTLSEEVANKLATGEF